MFFGKGSNKNLKTNAMKKLILSTLLILAICFSSYARKVVAEGNSPKMGNFTIEVAESPMVLDGVTLDTYLIRYTECGTVVKVAIKQEKKCNTYITMSDKLSVQYVCNGKYFGVEKLAKKYAEEGLKTDDASMDRDSYFHQRLLSPGKNDKIFCMQLIGAYFPELMRPAQG
jgi:hypothetical protein